MMKEDIQKALEQVRERGYAIDDEENVQGSRCIDASVASDDSDVLGALSISGSSQRMTNERIGNELEDAISKSANVIQINYKFT